jgi:dolichyl-diphosphooligosaccharide--protein glycosyltransferase/undecaprenyl-diphosphooligosaccharide--protein glycosyltransferase
MHDRPEFFWNDQLMINTNDGYFFASGAQKVLEGLHIDNPRVPGLWDYGLTFFTVALVKLTPFSLETVTLFMPALISSLVVIPMILIARLYGEALWGFFAALLGSIAWSYYNRTMVGYYDTDMFSAMAPMFILYFLIKSTIDFNLRSALYAAVAIVLYPFMYDQGQAIVYAMGIIYGAYMVWFHREEKTTYASLILVFLALMPLGLAKPLTYLMHTVLVLGVYAVLRTDRFERKMLMIASLVLFVLFMFFGDVIGLIWRKIYSYVVTGTQESGLHFYAVNQTVREAGKIPFATFANRIAGSTPGLLIAAAGYLLLVWRKRAFILALPLVGIGVFANWGGLRFTVYAVPVAAMAAVYLFWYLAEMFVENRWARLGAVALATAALIYPNITHIIGYRVPTVFSKAEVTDLVKLNEKASPKDYTLTWWDYGYPVWYYSDTSTLIDGGKHDNDNFIVSTILQTDSPKLAARLARLAVETYANDPKHRVVSNVLFHNKQPDQKDPNLFLAELESGAIKLPPKTRDIYLYLPYKMLGIFPTVMVFGNLDLTTGKAKRKPIFYPGEVVAKNGAIVRLSNGITLDLKKGTARAGQDRFSLAKIVLTQNRRDGSIAVTEQTYRLDGQLIAVYLQTYGQMIVMDRKTFDSIFVQMFMLGRYDPDLFEPVVSSPYSRIYRLKI